MKITFEIDERELKSVLKDIESYKEDEFARIVGARAALCGAIRKGVGEALQDLSKSDKPEEVN